MRIRLSATGRLPLLSVDAVDSLHSIVARVRLAAGLFSEVALRDGRPGLCREVCRRRGKG